SGARPDRHRLNSCSRNHRKSGRRTMTESFQIEAGHFSFVMDSLFLLLLVVRRTLSPVFALRQSPLPESHFLSERVPRLVRHAGSRRLLNRNKRAASRIRAPLNALPGSTCSIGSGLHESRMHLSRRSAGGGAAAT
ncbi:MAG: hypothetical protein AB7S59_18245, partial [Parvibaculaceae bacterium]